MSNLKVGGFTNQSEDNDLDYQPNIQSGFSGILIPQILSVGDISSINSDVSVTLENNKVLSKVFKDPIVGTGYKTILRQGRITRTKTYKNEAYSIENQLRLFNNNIKLNIYIAGRIKDLKIPNVGILLGGNLKARSKLYKNSQWLSVDDSRGPRFDIFYIKYDSTTQKGGILSIQEVSLKLFQNYKARLYNPKRPKTSAKLTLASSNFGISHDVSNAISTGIISGKDISSELTTIQPELNTSNNKITLRTRKISGTLEEFSGFITLQNLTPIQFRTLINEFAKVNDKKSEKIISSTTANFRNANIDSAYLVPNSEYSLNYINLLFLMIIIEVNPLVSDFDNVQYFVYEYFINKIYYAIRNPGDPSFDHFNLLNNKIINDYRKSPTPTLNNKLKEIYNKKKRDIFYYEYSEKLKSDEVNKMSPELKRLYRTINTEVTKDLCRKIVNHATYVKFLDSSTLSSRFLSNAAGVSEVTLEYKLKRILIKDALSVVN